MFNILGRENRLSQIKGRRIATSSLPRVTCSAPYAVCSGGRFSREAATRRPDATSGDASAPDDKLHTLQILFFYIRHMPVHLVGLRKLPGKYDFFLYLPLMLT